MKKLIIIFFYLMVISTCAYAQQFIDVEPGQSKIFSWDEVTTDTTGRTLSREDVFYQIWAAPMVGGVPSWNDKVFFLEENYRPAVVDDGKVATTAPVNLTRGIKYQIAITAYIYSKNNGAKLESEKSAELIVFNMIAGEAPPSIPGRFKVEVPFN